MPSSMTGNIASDASTASGRRTAAGHYLLGLGLLVFYGVQVCPYIETLPTWQWAVVLAATLVLVQILRLALEPALVLGAPVALRARRQFWLDFGLYASGGLAVTLIDLTAFGFPVESGLKVLLGCSCLGFFMGLDMALHRERAAVLSGDYAKGPFARTLPFASLTRKFALAATAAVLFAALIVGLVVLKDFIWLHESGRTMDFGILVRGVALEIGFVGAALLGLTLRVIWSYSRNLRLLFDMETEVLAAVGRDDLERMVPVITDDEFGAVAEHTNEMIDGLREKRRIRSTLGKVVDEAVVDRLLAADAGAGLGGARRELAILVSDVRGFTSRTENADPERLVADLNRYFTRMVAVVRDHGGVVDKFIGDGLLAVFGLDAPDGGDGGDGGAGDAAVAAARDMLTALDEVNRELSEPMRIGIGVHAGSVISGLIGSPERLEFTVIGDAVNTAARLESLTKELGSPIAISARVREGLSGALAHGWEDMGPRALKGKAESVRVFAHKA